MEIKPDDVNGLLILCFISITESGWPINVGGLQNLYLARQILLFLQNKEIKLD